ncbi:MAG: hypothetical protein ACREMZ_03030 [Gemmatimonadales bacterium]
MSHRTPDEPGRPRRRRPPRGPLLWLLLLLLLCAGVAGYYLISRPRLVFSNRLAGAVRLAIAEGDTRTIPPGQSVRVSVPRGRTLVALWELVRPLSADGRPMGEEVRGSLVEREAGGTVRRSATARSQDADFFAPLITNASDHLLRVTVNAWLEGALDCGCAVRPGARRVFIGYYRLYRNSTVEARAGDRSAVFRDLGPGVVTINGTVGLRFEERDLRTR